MTLEFATISGIRLGFGYNSYVRSPAISEITQFPFIDDHSLGGSGNNPMAILQTIMSPPSGTPWISPQHDMFWFAAGLSVDSFNIIAVTAVALFAFGSSGLVITLYADAIAQMPPDVKDASELLVYVEIGMIAELNFAEGYFIVEASLAPTSFLLVPDCHLYGQFAMAYWFPVRLCRFNHLPLHLFYTLTNSCAAQWPSRRLGILSPEAITPNSSLRPGIPNQHGWAYHSRPSAFPSQGEAYFAITPQCVMGGASIRASLSVGPVDAWLDAAFDALINFHPLHYEVGFHVSVGVDCHIDFWFVHIHVTASVGAYLVIQGPEFGGSA